MSKPTRSQLKLQCLEKRIKNAGVRLGYERMQFAGLRLRSGLCWFKGQYYLFVDRRKSVPERIELLHSALEDLAGQTQTGPGGENEHGGMAEETPEQPR
ncbi:MAG: hypothetical protein LBJ14_04095 [Desulfarculales bacterium]|nr:hypothetical protein [Desulfarculales bacterium]